MFVCRFSIEICLNYTKPFERDLSVMKRGRCRRMGQSKFDSGMKVVEVRDEVK